MKVLLVTTNPGKVREVNAILAGSGLEVEDVPMFLGAEETGVTYLENARLKALAALRLAARSVIAEDSGIEVDALGGAPGPWSARFAGAAATDEANNLKLLRLLGPLPDAKRTARYRSVCVLLLPDGTQVVGEGVFEGRISAMPRGTNGFGYDPLFFPAGETRTVGEMREDEKNIISHRSKALRQLVVRAREARVLE